MLEHDSIRPVIRVTGDMSLRILHRKLDAHASEMGDLVEMRAYLHALPPSGEQQPMEVDPPTPTMEPVLGVHQLSHADLAQSCGGYATLTARAKQGNGQMRAAS